MLIERERGEETTIIFREFCGPGGKDKGNKAQERDAKDPNFLNEKSKKSPLVIP